MRLIGRLPLAARVSSVIAILNCVAWSLLTPPFHVPDETTHFSYVQHLAETGRPPGDVDRPLWSTEETLVLRALRFDLTVGRKNDRGVWSPSQEAALRALADRRVSRSDGGGFSNTTSQPPTYYALGAVAYWLSPKADLLTRLWMIRLISSLLAGGTALFTVLFLRELMPNSPWSWTVGGLVAAFQPVFGFMSGGAQSDALLFFASALLFFAVARGFARGLTPQTAALLGSSVALGVLGKINFLGFVPGAALAAAVIALRATRQARRFPTKAVAVGLLAAGLPVLCYVALNVAVWDRPWWSQSVQGQTDEALAGRAGGAKVPVLQQLGYIWQLYLPRLPFMYDQFDYFPMYDTWWKSWIGVFGWVDYEFRAWVYALALGIFGAVGACAAVDVYRVRKRLRSRAVEALCFAVLAGGLLFEMGLFGIRYREVSGFNFEQGRYLVPLLPLYAVIPALAVRGVGARLSRPVGAVIVVAALGHSLFAMLLTISRFYG